MSNRFTGSIRNKIQRFWRSKYRNYILVTVFFLFWMAFLSPNTIGNQIKARKELRSLEKTKRYYEKEIRHNEEMILRFQSDLDFVERYGREQYLMKKDNEDIYLFVESPNREAKGFFDFLKKKKD